MAARATATSVAAKAAGVIFQCKERMFEPGLANLFEPLSVIDPAAHAIKVLRDDRVIGVWQRKPIDRLVAIIAGSRCHCETDLGP